MRTERNILSGKIVLIRINDGKADLEFTTEQEVLDYANTYWSDQLRPGEWFNDWSEIRDFVIHHLEGGIR